MTYYFLQNIIIRLQGNCKECIQTLFRRKINNLAQLMVQCKKHTLLRGTWGRGRDVQSAYEVFSDFIF